LLLFLGNHPVSEASIELANEISGARGLGYNMAQGLAEAGAQGIALLDYQEALGLLAVEKLRQDTGVEAKFIRSDVRDTSSVISAVNAVHEHFGKIDIALNAAGIAE
jgi:NAD(P)-dependent dehydrogenase (short-subunit alcohol dehydrogenase family)